MKVQFGCGGNPLNGFVNHDSEVDISKPLPYQDNSVEFIHIEHCLEHVNCHEGTDFLKEARRILMPGGTLRVCVPILTMIDDRIHALDLIYNHGHQMVYSTETLSAMLWAVGFEWGKIRVTDRSDIDGHWRVIGKEKDDLETLRMEATK